MGMVYELEWRYEPLPIHGWRVLNEHGGVIACEVYSEEIAAQIVAGHKAAKSQALLVEALRGVAIMLNTELESFEGEPWAQRVRTALRVSE